MKTEEFPILARTKMRKATATEQWAQLHEVREAEGGKRRFATKESFDVLVLWVVTEYHTSQLTNNRTLLLTLLETGKSIV